MVDDGADVDVEADELVGSADWNCPMSSSSSSSIIQCTFELIPQTPNALNYAENIF